MANTDPCKTGLAFSGGGIRSAAFCSGVLRRLLERNADVDYLSCVSGGGYIGSAFLDWKYRKEIKSRSQDDRNWHNDFFKHMEDNAGYLCQWQKPLHGALDTIIVIGLALLVNFVEPMIMWGSYACPIAFIIDLLFGKYLRDVVNCEDAAAAKAAHSNVLLADHNATTQEIQRHCLSRQGTADSYEIILFSILFVLFFIFFILARRCSRKRFSSLFSFIRTTFAAFFALTFLPFVIHDFIIKIPNWTQYLIVLAGIMAWFFLPFLRQKTSYVLMIYFFSYVIYWKVYEADLAGIAYSTELFNRLLFISGFVMWIIPLVSASQVRLMHVYNRWRLQRAFYHPDHSGKNGCSGIGWYDIFPLWSCACRSQHTNGSDDLACLEEDVEAVRPLSLEDLQGMKPEYLSNIVVNRWQKDEKCEEDYELLTMSPTTIERLDEKPGENQFTGKLEPKDIKLSDAMATSAAAISAHMGKYDKSVQGLTRLHTLLGFEMGANKISDMQSVKNETLFWKVLPFLVNIVRVLPLITVPALYYSEHTETSIRNGVISFIVIHLILALIAVIDTGGKQGEIWYQKVVRWFVVHISFVQFVRTMLSKINTGPTPPPIMLLSDGGHIENLALLPLLKKRLKKIIVVDGGYKHNNKLYGESLLNAMMLARTKLNCSFISKDGGDVISDLYDTFVKLKDIQEGKQTGKLPRYFKFRVQYNGRDEGEILLITPRHPSDGVPCDKEPHEGTPALHQFDPRHGLDGGIVLKKEEVDNLTLCCCECCHGEQLCGLSEFCCNVFPQHNTANQFFTSRMFAAYHREGYRACVEAEKDDYMKKYWIQKEPTDIVNNLD